MRLKKIQGVTSSIRCENEHTVTIQTIALKNAFNNKTNYSTCELDQHADTCCLGSNFLMIHDTQRRCFVIPYNNKYEPISNVKVISGATVYTNPTSNLTFILWIDEYLYFGKTVEYSLLNLNILRYNDIIIQDNPYHSSKNIKIEAYTTNDEDILIPLSSTCVDNYFDSRTPNSHELDSCHHVHLTNVIQEWNSFKIVFPNGKRRRMSYNYNRSQCGPHYLQIFMMLMHFIIKFHNYHMMIKLHLILNLLLFLKKARFHNRRGHKLKMDDKS